jgi:RNA polymerase sigma factor (sigma-70 family)
VLQDLFVSLVQKEQAPDRPEHYCVRAFRNRALNYRRSLWRRVLREFESVRWFERSEDETPQERAAMAALIQLPLEQREAIVLKIWHQYTFEEIGSLLDISPNTAAGRYRYGLQKLRSALKGDDYERLESSGTTVTFLDTTASLAQS